MLQPLRGVAPRRYTEMFAAHFSYPSPRSVQGKRNRELTLAVRPIVMAAYNRAKGWPGFGITRMDHWAYGVQSGLWRPPVPHPAGTRALAVHFGNPHSSLSGSPFDVTTPGRFPLRGLNIFALGDVIHVSLLIGTGAGKRTLCAVTMGYPPLQYSVWRPEKDPERELEAAKDGRPTGGQWVAATTRIQPGPSTLLGLMPKLLEYITGS